jgi:acyl carrier protein
MKLNEFIELVKESFDELETDLTHSTVYKQIDEWTSMQALILIAHLDDNLGVVLDADDLKNTTTIEDLYTLVLKKKKV